MTQTKPKSVEAKCRVRTHSATQIEVVLDLPKPPSRFWECRIVLLAPRQFHVTSSTYPKELVFQDIDSFIRFREPRYRGKELLSNAGFGIRRVAEELLLFDPLHANSAIRKRRIQTLCRLFASGYFDYINRRLMKLEVMQSRRQTPSSKLADHVGKTIDRAFTSLNEWIKLSEDFAEAELAKGIKGEIAAVREFCAYTFADALARLVGLLQREPTNLKEITSRCDLFLVQQKIQEIFAHYGYGWVGELTSIEERETLLNRKRKLKLRMMSDLFLSVSDTKRFWIEEHFGAMVAAAIAAVWATSINLAVLNMANMETRLAEIGISGMTVFAVVVAAYVLKDRIKEVGKQHFRSTLSRFLADRLRRVSTAKDATEQQQRIVAIREKIDYCSVGEVLERYKLNKRFAFLDRQSTAICLVQDFRYPRKVLRPTPGELRQITRINVGRFLDRLDEPFVKTYAMTEGGEVKEFVLPKNYYAGIIVLTRKSKKEAWNSDTFKVILSKQGLLEALPIKGPQKTGEPQVARVALQEELRPATSNGTIS